MPHRPHWNPEPSKDDLVTDVDELLERLTGDPTERIRDPGRITKRDLKMLERVMSDAAARLPDKRRRTA